jgi:hypothetical protein
MGWGQGTCHRELCAPSEKSWGNEVTSSQGRAVWAPAESVLNTGTTIDIPFGFAGSPLGEQKGVPRDCVTPRPRPASSKTREDPPWFGCTSRPQTKPRKKTVELCLGRSSLTARSCAVRQCHRLLSCATLHSRIAAETGCMGSFMVAVGRTGRACVWASQLRLSRCPGSSGERGN